jgi:hypothetical protein
MEPKQASSISPVPDREEATAGVDPKESQTLQTEAQKNLQEVVQAMEGVLGSLPEFAPEEEWKSLAQEAHAAASLEEGEEGLKPHEERAGPLRKDFLFKTHHGGKSSKPKKKPLHEKRTPKLAIERASDPPSDLVSESSSLTYDPEHTAAAAAAIEQQQSRPKEKEGEEPMMMIAEEDTSSNQEIAGTAATGVNTEIPMTQALSDLDRVRRIVELTPVSDERPREEHLVVEEEEEERKIAVVLPSPVMR